jgi:eukaryotic-like serine/threonine-protein kinase
LTSERWRQIEELYHSAREKGGEALVGADPEIRREVERLLAQGSESGDKLLDQDAADLIADTVDAQLTPGTQLGPYRIEQRLGQGGMGQVYRATDTRLDRPVAIKICKRAFLDRFRQESRSIAAISHPNVCTLHDVGPNYLVMELVEGETMAARLKRGRLDPHTDPSIRSPDCRSLGRGSRAGHRAPGFEAREHHDDEDRRQSAGLRLGPIAR